MVAAFAQVLRRIVFDVDQGDEAWLHKLASAGFPKEDIDFMYERVCEFSFADHFSGDTSSRGNTLDFKVCEQHFVNGWMSQEYIPNVVQVTRGSSAGTPLADLIYSLAMSRVLETFRLAVSHCDLLSKIGSGEEAVTFREVSFVDDVAIPISGSASDILDKVSDITECAIRILLATGWS